VQAQARGAGVQYPAHAVWTAVVQDTVALTRPTTTGCPGLAEFLDDDLDEPP
jgi:hypothetical protein